MRGIIFFLCLLISSFAFSQTTYYIQADSVRFRKIGANSEFILENSTRNIPGILVNKGNGRTEFSRARISGDTLFIGRDTVLGVGGGGTGTVTNLTASDANGFDFTITNPTTTPNIGLTTSLTTTRVPFIGASGALSQDEGLNYISGTNTLGGGAGLTVSSGTGTLNLLAPNAGGSVFLSPNSITQFTTENGGRTFLTTSRLEEAKGTEITTDTEILIPKDGNLFTLTGSTTIESIDGQDAQAGTKIGFLFDAAPLLVNEAGTGAADLVLAGRVDFQAAAGDYIEFRSNGTEWYEINRVLAGSIGLTGSIADDQIAFGNGTAITGSNNLTYNGSLIKFIVSTPFPQLRIEGVEDDGVHGLDIWRSNGDGHIYFNATQGIGIFRFQDAGTDMFRLDNTAAYFSGTVQLEAHGIFKENAAPSAPTAGYVSIYPKSDGLWYGKDDAGVETKLSNAAAGIDDVLAVGQTLTTNRNIDASTFELSVSGSATSPNNTFEVTNSSSGTALQVTGTSGTGVNITNSSGTGIIASSTTGLAGLFAVNPASTNSVVAAFTPRRQTSGSAAAGIGVSIPLEVEGTGSTIAANTIKSVLTNVGAGTQHSQFIINGYNAGTPADIFTIDGDGRIILTGRLQTDKGIDVASANDLTLGADGNVFVITGTTTINAITTANWQAGSEITLVFTGVTTVKHNTAGGGGTARMFLAGSVDLSTANHTTLTLVYDGTQWQEKSRKIP